MKDNSDYRVGYGCPPTGHQFQPGKSGNPSGRPKGARSFKSDLLDELGELIDIAEGNQNVQITKQRAIIKVVVSKAIAGDPRAIATVVNLCAPTMPEDGDEAEAPEDRAIMQAIAAYGPNRSADTTAGAGKNGPRPKSEKEGAR